MSKYLNIPKVVDGIKFASLKEAARYRALKKQQEKGEISDLDCHPKFILQEMFFVGGEKHRTITYAADFCYLKNNIKVIEDVKGGKVTQVYALKKRLFLKKIADKIDAGKIVFREIR